MKKHSMLCAAILIICANTYGVVMASLFRPTAFGLIIAALLTILLVAYIQFSKRRILLETAENASYVLFGLLICAQVFYTITSFALLAYMSDLEVMKATPDSKLQGLVVGIETMSPQEISTYNLPFYFSNFFLFMYYLRCYYVMFWRQNIVFIFRYLKTKVNELNQTLLSHLPKIKYNPELADTICSLCLQEYHQEEKITRLHCTHVYHLDCIKVWVMRSNCCPLCRKRVVY